MSKKIPVGEKNLTQAVKSVSQVAPGSVLDNQEQVIDKMPSQKKKGFIKGQSGNVNGRPKGSISVKTKVLTAFAHEIVNGNIEKFNTELNKMKGKPYIDTIMGLMEYCIPKLARTESLNVNLQTKEPQIIKLGDQEFTIN